jgi:predicted porin
MPQVSLSATSSRTIRLRRGARRLLGAAALLGAGAACGADFSVGIGAYADRGRVDCVASFPCDRSSAGAKLFAGYRVGPALAVQAVWFDSGHFKGGDTTPLGTEFGGSFKVSGFGLAVDYRREFAPSWSLEGRAGLAAVRTRFDYANPAFASVSKTTAQPLLGLGLGYEITPGVRLSVDYDATRFKVHTTRGPLQMLGLTAQYSF